MTPHLFYVDPSDLTSQSAAGDTLVVGGAEGHHGVAVKRLRVGEVVTVGNGEGLVATGSVSRVIGRGQFEFTVDSSEETAPQSPRIVVAQALIKSDRLELAVDSMTEAGVDEIAFWAADHSIVKQSAKARIYERLNRHAWEASKQARRPRRTVLAFDRTFSGLLEMVDAADKTFVLDEAASDVFSEVVRPGEVGSAAVLVVVGPEGGFSDSEREQLVAHGAQRVRMGSSVMRASTAGTVALGWLMGASGRWQVGDSTHE